ncbi:MAG: TPM domain-containing protein [Deltaproteobacteria bacterium]|nr:TPM domain-containing protein [Deltaproteobacteria bacterium]
MKILRPGWFIAALLAGIPASALARFEPPPPPKTYVHDGAKMLDDGTRTRIESLLEELNQRRKIQFVVATFPSLAGDSLEEASLRTAENWKIGHKGVDSGLLLVIFRDDRQLRFETGYGLEGVFTDFAADQIIRKVIVPRFREGDFSGGISAGVHAAADVLITGKVDFGPDERDTAGSPAAIDTIISLLIMGFILWSIFAAPRRRYPYYGGGFGRGGGFGGGFGGGGGGFGGGGGGFGGGGASGRW